MNDKLSLNISNIDFSKIARNAADARNGRFLKESQIQKKYWEENNGLSYVKRLDGTALIFDGNTPMGFTPISALETWTGNNNLSNNNSSNNNLSSSNLSKIIRKSIDESNKNAQNNVTTNSNVQSSSNIQTSSISNLVSTPEKTESSSTINTDNTTKSTNTSSTAKPQISNVSKVVATNLTSSVKTDTSNKSISKKTSIIGKFKVKNGKTYFINSKGKKVTGIKEINGKIYYFDKKGVMKTNCLHKNKDGTYKYFGKKGYAVSGFRKLNGRIYYFSPTTKNSVKGKQKINNKIYYFNAKGVMQTGLVKWKNGKYKDRYSYFNKKGEAVTGFKKINGKTYFFNSKTYASIKGKHEINNRIYYFKKNGEMVTGWVQWKKNKKWSYFGKSGIMYTGKAKVDGHVYNFGKKGLVKKVSDWVKNGDKYVFYYKNGTKKTFDKSCYNSWKRIQKLDSKTKYLLALDRKTKYFSVFVKEKGQWVPKYSWRCTIGLKLPESFEKNEKYRYLTPSGIYKLGHKRGCSRRSNRKGTPNKGVWYTIRILKLNGSRNIKKWDRGRKIARGNRNDIWLHSTYARKYNGKIHADNKEIGHNRTGGCISNTVENQRWLFYNCKAGTTLYIW